MEWLLGIIALVAVSGCIYFGVTAVRQGRELRYADKLTNQATTERNDALVGKGTEAVRADANATLAQDGQRGAAQKTGREANDVLEAKTARDAVNAGRRMRGLPDLPGHADVPADAGAPAEDRPATEATDVRGPGTPR